MTAELANATDGLWLGLYQNGSGLGPAKGWNRCVGGDAPSFTNWQEGQPNEYHGYLLGSRGWAWDRGVGGVGLGQTSAGAAARTPEGSCGVNSEWA